MTVIHYTNKIFTDLSLHINMKKNQTYYSNGKLLLTGEYLVLEGALALAVPTKLGQNLKATPIKEPIIDWKSIDNKGEVWFEKKFKLPIANRKKSDAITDTLKNILLEVQKQNPNFLSGNQGFKLITKLDFPRDWGLGSSSTLINNIAQWAGVNAFDLLQKTMGGSGYDIACAQNNTPITYKLTPVIKNKVKFLKEPQITSVNFKPNFSEQLYFVYLNKKQRSHKEIQRFQKIKTGIKEGITTVSEITNLLVKTTQLDDFELLIKEHEKLLSTILKLPTIQELQFKDYFGQTKSLGAWGGDFILATGNDDTPHYFQKKGFKTLLLYDEMVK